MRHARFLLPILAMLTAAGCARHGQQAHSVLAPAAGQPGVQRYVESGGGGAYAQAQPQYASQVYAYQQPQAAPPASGRGLFNTFHASGDRYIRHGQAPSSQTQPAYRRLDAQPPTVMRYQPPAQPSAKSGTTVYGYAYAPATTSYTLDSGDRLRVVVFGQEGISGSYLVDAGGNVTLPLIGSVPARGATTKALSHTIAERLEQGYVRQPHVTVSIEQYRPFFILGEVTTPGQYPYVANMTVENAVAIAGGFSPRAYKGKAKVTRSIDGHQVIREVPFSYRLKPGDTVQVEERWF
jgi:polysaccharide export outer membrane protein